MCLLLCTILVHSTALNSSDNLPSYSLDNHHSSDDVCWRGERFCQRLLVSLIPSYEVDSKINAAFRASRSERSKELFSNEDCWSLGYELTDWAFYDHKLPQLIMMS